MTRAGRLSPSPPPACCIPHFLIIGAATTAASVAPVSTLKIMQWSLSYEHYLQPKAQATVNAL